MQDDSGLKRMFTIASVYELSQNLVGAKRSRTWLAKNFWKLQGGEKVVDIGCGPGVALSYLPNKIEYYGFDISASYIKKAREKFGERGEFFIGSVYHFLDKNDSRLDMADLILCNGLLHHLDDNEAIDVLKLSKKIMHPAGRLVCIEPTFLTHQDWLSKWIISNDRGKNVRIEHKWKELTSTVFNSFSTNIITGLLRIPYTHIIIECRREA